ncbi:axonemal dynein light chain domain-containing protein 1 isoform X2 [Strongylocentrotus purpuratus]|uniref:Axonemal dynein light chain domain-containing protein 1 n=1 Tax=Strongylocentrotus purpuratus TaxID=7668 RepID=A0A7M7PNK6_STRPU|nr:axonemal dynein light chain domain-containing protein 1 isoform X2 [Strongylocentrotus purpuratus]
MTAVAVAPDVGNFPKPPDPTPMPSESGPNSPVLRKEKGVISKLENEGSPLPELRSSDYYIDKTKPLPTSLQSDFIPEDILSALTQLPKPVGKDKLKAPGKAKSTFPTDQKAIKSGPPANVWNFPSRRRKFQHLTDQPVSVTGAGRDISFLYDVAMNGSNDPRALTSDPSAKRGIEKHSQSYKAMTVPNTLVPSEYHVVKAKGVQHLEFQEEKFNTQLKNEDDAPVVFPSLKPSSRYEVMQLKESLQAMLNKAGVNDEGAEVKGPTQMHNLLELVKKEQNIYNIIFHELIRQVSVECIERGELLSSVRELYNKLLDKVPRQIKSLHQEVMAQRALDRRLTEELFRFKSTISDLTNELSDVREHDKVVTGQAQQAQEQLAAALAESEKSASLLGEYHELYELQRRRLEKQVFHLTSERDLWSNAAYSLALKVTEANSLTTARRLHICEKAWSKLTHHFTIVLSDRDTVQLSQLQVLVERHRLLMIDFSKELKIDDVTSKERLALIRSGIKKWMDLFYGSVVYTVEESKKIRFCLSGQLEASIVESDFMSGRQSSRASDKINTILHAPGKEMIQALYEDIRLWEENLNKEVERFGGDILLGHEESLYDIKKQTDQWTETAIQIFSRHMPTDGSEYPDHEKLVEMNLVCEAMCKQFHTRVNGENGTAKGFIQITNALESWDTKLNSILNGGAMPMEAEWLRLYELFSDWIRTINEVEQNIGSEQSEDDKAEGKPFNPMIQEEVFRLAQKWVATTINGIDSQDSKLMEQVSVLHADMVHWMIQVLLRLAPNPPESPQEVIDACMASAWSLTKIQEKVVGLFDRITAFSNYITSCCSSIVSAEMQQKIDNGEQNADQESRDLRKIRSECSEWIHMATILMDEVRSVEMARLGGEELPTPLHVPEGVQGGDPRMDSQGAFTPGMPDRGELVGTETPITMSDRPPGTADTLTTQRLETPKSAPLAAPLAPPVGAARPTTGNQKTPSTANSQRSVLPGSTPGADDLTNMSEMQVLGYDQNVWTQSLDEFKDQPSQSAPKEATSAKVLGAASKTPDTSKAYEALTAVKSLQQQLVTTEERAQTAEEKVQELEEELKTLQERMRVVERKSATPAILSVTPGPVLGASTEPPKTAPEAPITEEASTTAPGSAMMSPAETPFTSFTKDTMGEQSTPLMRPGVAGVGPLPTPTITPSPPPTPGRKTSASPSRPTSRASVSSRGSAKSRKK